MNTRQALVRSVEITPDVLATTIATQRKQLSDQIVIAQKAFDQEDLDMWATAARHAANVKKSLEENLEMQRMTRVLMVEATSERLGQEILSRARGANGPDKAEALSALEMLIAEAKTITKKAGGDRVRR